MKVITPQANDKGKKVLFLFTTSYPYGNFEQNLNIEAEFLSQYFEKVYVFSIEQGKSHRSMPPNFYAIDISKLAIFKKNVFFSQLFGFLIISFQEISKTPFSGSYYLKHVKNCFSKLFNAYSIANALDNLIIKEGLQQDEIHFYSYWFYHWALVSAFFKKRGTRTVNVVSRGQMADLYQDPYDFAPNPFHYFKLKKIDRFFSTSAHGANYLKNKFPEFEKKIGISRSGISTASVNPFPAEDEFIIVTCSTLQKRKRIYLMPEILKRIKFNIKWVHFGDGPEMNDLKGAVKVLPDNVKVELRGFIENKDLFLYYENSPISVFLNLSTAEGLPFSIIEAIAFGIPIIATDVFGTPEVCTPETGLLLPKELDAEMVANTLIRFKDSAMNSASFRKNVKTFWDEEYNSDRNYIDFIERAFGELVNK